MIQTWIRKNFPASICSEKWSFDTKKIITDLIRAVDNFQIDELPVAIGNWPVRLEAASPKDYIP